LSSKFQQAADALKAAIARRGMHKCESRANVRQTHEALNRALRELGELERTPLDHVTVRGGNLVLMHFETDIGASLAQRINQYSSLCSTGLVPKAQENDRIVIMAQADAESMALAYYQQVSAAKQSSTDTEAHAS
jgi:hypothetical protein